MKLFGADTNFGLVRIEFQSETFAREVKVWLEIFSEIKNLFKIIDIFVFTNWVWENHKSEEESSNNSPHFL